MDNLDKQELAQSYGFALAFMRSNDELWHLFNQAVKQTWTADRFVARLRGTDWFKHHSANVRNAILQQTADPATYEAAVDQMYSTVKDAYGAMFGRAGMDSKQLRGWAETAHRMGWSQAQLMDRLTQSINYRKMLRDKSLGGSAGELEGQLRTLTTEYGVTLGPQWRANQIKKILSGDDTLGAVQKRIQEQAMREYKAFADEIAGGRTVRDVAESYIQRYADLLELNPADVSLDNKTIQSALRQRTPDGKPAAMDLNDFSDMVRQDSRWQYTNNAREEVSSKVLQLARLFGQVG